VDRRWTDVGEYSPTVPTAVHAIATGSSPMITSAMTDGREPVSTTSGCAVTRRGRPGLALGCSSDRSRPRGGLRRPSLWGRWCGSA